MIFKDITSDITRQMIADVDEQRRSQQISDYERRYDEYTGNVLRDVAINGEQTIRSLYFPKGHKESTDVYAERMQSAIWVPWSKIICSRLAAAVLGNENVERKWVAVDDKSKSIADRANEYQQYVDKENCWNELAPKIYELSLALGEISLWPEFRYYNKSTGEKYAVDKGIGIPIWQWHYPWFAEPVVDQRYVNEIIGAVKFIWADGAYARPWVNQSLGLAGQTGITELWLAPRYDHVTGQAVENNGEGFYRIWRGSEPDVSALSTMGNEGERWWVKNFYECCPVVFFRGPDPDETQYRGEAWSERFRDLALKHSRLVSDIGHACQILSTIWIFTGDKKMASEITIRKNEIVCLPNVEGGAKFEQSVSQLNLTEEWKLCDYYAHIIDMVGMFPSQSFESLTGSGKVESGVALKILFRPLIDAIGLIRSAMAEAEKQRMSVCVKMFNAHNQLSKIDLTKIRPEVEYHNNPIPVDEASELINDVLKMEKGAMSKATFAMRYNNSLRTEAEAEDFLKKNSPQQAPQSGSVFSQIRQARQQANGNTPATR